MAEFLEADGLPELASMATLYFYRQSDDVDCVILIKSFRYINRMIIVLNIIKYWRCVNGKI